ncbi:TIGR03943 family putative permease subunit [Shimazuella kribbensis]|uniref:TIGR03943 family putative permease subunit n=1 Tax=Shimazuella kribbensis TaxID=139808 RepID=UPI000406DAC7|nr:TIGR03943 family protein [Shimazuella kribbensis]
MAAILRVCILFSLAILLTYLILSRQLNYFIHPRIQYFSIFGFAALIILGIIQMKNIRHKAMHPIGIWGYIMISLPIFFFVLFPSKPSDANLADQKVYTYIPPAQVDKKTKKDMDATQLQEEDWEAPYKKQAAEFKKLPTIILTKENFIDVTNVLAMYPEDFKGKKVRMVGFVYREEGFEENQFVIARLSMACCVADAGVVGFFVETKRPKVFQKDQWYQIDGTFEMKKRETGEVPGLKIEQYKRVPALKDSYVYQKLY